MQQQPKFEIGKDNLTPEFKAKSPMGKVPVLTTSEGAFFSPRHLYTWRWHCYWHLAAAGSIFESNAIARYVARLRPDTNLMGHVRAPVPGRAGENGRFKCLLSLPFPVQSFWQTGQVESWVDFCAHDVELPATLWVFPILGFLDFHSEVCFGAHHGVSVS